MKKLFTLWVGLGLLLHAYPLLAQVNYTANNQVPAYNSNFAYGINVGYHPNFTDNDKTDLIAGVNGHTIRNAMFEYFMDFYGVNVRSKEFAYAQSKGMTDVLTFISTGYNPFGTDGKHRDHTKYDGSAKESVMTANLYSPIWDNGENGTPVNDNNYYALFVYNFVKNYGQYVRFYEVMNEPDIAIYNAYDKPGTPGNLWDNAMKATDLPALNAPIFHYIRLMRITYDIVKTYDPDAYICTGGIGYPVFLDNLLRYTDNPDGGKVTAEYPNKGGAYFDMLSYHYYPEYTTRYWDNASNGFKYTRHSDSAVETVFQGRDELENLMIKYGYNGTTYPKKLIMLSEVNVPRKSFPDLRSYTATPEYQSNFNIKILIKAQAQNLKQVWVYDCGDNVDEATYQGEKDGQELMGMYYNLNAATVGNTKLTKQGIAFKTTAGILYPSKYDASKTAGLSLPSNADGGAFIKSNGDVVYVLWAKTKTDLNENDVTVNFTFPQNLGVKSIKVKKWDYSQTNVEETINGSTITLTGYPVFITLSQDAAAVNQLPVVSISAPANNTAYIQGDAIVLKAIASDPDGTVAKVEFYDGSTKIGESTGTIFEFSWINALVGVHTITAKAYDNKNAITTSAAITVTVNAKPVPPPANQPPTANAGADQTITLPTNTVTLKGSGADPEGGALTYSWAKSSGGAATLSNDKTANLTVTGLVEGVYTFLLTVIDDKGGSAVDEVVVTVKPQPVIPNQSPVVALTAPTNNSTFQQGNTVTLTATASDPDGTVAKVEFYQGTTKLGEDVSSPYQFAWSGMAPGIYKLTAKAYDNKGAVTTSAEITVTINSLPTNQAPVANAGADQSITLPTSTATFNGSGSDPEGQTITYLWTQVSGVIVTLTNSNTKSLGVSGITATGSYTFRLTVTDDKGAKSSDDVILTVSAAPIPPVSSIPIPSGNRSPIVSAGNDLNVNLPIDKVIIKGTASDPDGSIVKISWSLVSGPNVNYTGFDKLELTLKNLQAGTYVFRLTATDNQGGSGSDEVSVIVSDANLPKPMKVFAPVKDPCWKIDNIDLYPNNRIVIFNQTGQWITTLYNYGSASCWGASKDGKALPEGTYYYIIENNSTGQLLLKGSIALLR
jgi:gliding motility-associated-like protein